MYINHGLQKNEQSKKYNYTQEYRVQQISNIKLQYRLTNPVYFIIIKIITTGPQRMKKQPLKSQQSCIDLTKYKFIPPAKLLKAKNANHFQSMVQSSITEDSSDSVIKANMIVSDKIDKKVNNNNKQNQNKDKLCRSISNPKLQTSASRHSLLPQKTPTFQLNLKHQQQHLEKLASIIDDLQNKELNKNTQLACLKEENKMLNSKIQKISANLNMKNKQVMELTAKIHVLESQLKEKSDEHSLIVDSLKKIIESQSQKINEVKAKYQKMLKIKSIICQLNPTNSNEKSTRIQEKSGRLQQDIAQDDEEHDAEMSVFDDLNDDDIMSGRCKEQQQKDRPTKCKGFLKLVRSSLKQQQQNLEESRNKQQNSSRLNTQLSKFTPDFGARTPQSIPQQDKFSSLESSLMRENPNLTLSRISESVQQQNETSREMIKISPQKLQSPSLHEHYQLPQVSSKHKLLYQKQNSSLPISSSAPAVANNNTKLNNNTNTFNNTNSRNTTNVSTHQQLLDEIDQYLSKNKKTQQPQVQMQVKR